MAKNIDIGGRLHSTATGNIVVGTNEIYDDDKGKKQSEINVETYNYVENINNALENLNPEQQEALGVAEKANNNEAKLGYYVCGTESNVAAKVISDATGYVLSLGGNIKVKMTNANIVDNATLNINSTGEKALYYNGERASANNSWEAGETVEVYYDGTSFYANNVAGSGGDGVFDVSEKYPTSGVEGGNTYTLDGALAVLNANLPASKKKGGMSIKFVQSSDNKYVQARLMANSFTTDVTQWQGVDTKPKPNSINLVESGGVAVFTDNLSFSDTDNILNVYPVLSVASDISYDNGEWIGASNKLNGKTFNVTAEIGAYTLSFKGYSEQNQQASGTVFKMTIKYSDNSTTELPMSTSVSDWTQLSVTTSSSKQIVSISFSYGVGGGNIIHLKEIQLRKGSTVLSYVPPVTAIDYNARKDISNINTEISGLNSQVSSLSSDVNVLNKNVGNKSSVSKELAISSSIQNIVTITNAEKIYIDNISNTTNLSSLRVQVVRSGVSSYGTIALQNGEYKEYAGADEIKLYVNANEVSTAGIVSFDLSTGNSANINKHENSIIDLQAKEQYLEGGYNTISQNIPTNNSAITLATIENAKEISICNITNGTNISTLNCTYKKGTNPTEYPTLNITEGATVKRTDSGKFTIGINANRITKSGKLEFDLFVDGKSYTGISLGKYIGDINKDNGREFVVNKQITVSSSSQAIANMSGAKQICLRNIVNFTDIDYLNVQVIRDSGSSYDSIPLIEGVYKLYEDANEVRLYINGNRVNKAGNLSLSIYTNKEAFSYKGNIPQYDFINSNRANFNELLQQLKRETRYQLTPGSWNGRPKPISLLYFSDVHHGNNAQLKNIKRFMDVYNSFLDDAIHTGDSMGSKYSDSEGFSWWDDCGLQSVLNVIGNHDVIEDGGVINSYNRYIAPYVSLWGVTQPANAAVDGLCYYYKDYDASGQNIRLIVIDCMHYDSAQNTWLGNVLGNARTNNMGVVIATHYPVGSTEYVLHNTSFTSLQVAISEFTNSDAVSAVDTFIENGGEFICWLTGHLHADVLLCLTTHHNQFCISTSNDNSYNTQYNDNGRDLGSKSADNLNVVAFDRYSKIVKLARFGGNYDRWMRHKETFCWDYENAQFIYTD